MAPDGVAALPRVTVRLVATCVDDLEVVDVAVRLGEVAVLVVVVAVLDVERLQVVLDLLHGLTVVEALLHPQREGVADQELRALAHDAAAVVAAVASLVERNLDPLGHVTVDGVGTRGLVLVELRHPVEVEVLVVGAVVVGPPLRAVVDRAVRLRDLVVERAVVPLRRAVRGEGARVGSVVLGLVAERRVAGVAELREHDEDPVGAGLGHLREPALAELLDRAGAGVARAQALLQRRLPQRVVLLAPLGNQVVRRCRCCTCGLGVGSRLCADLRCRERHSEQRTDERGG